MKLVADSLVLYKTHPAKVLIVGEKIEIALVDRQIKKVRPKDLQVLHPGPVQDLADLTPLDGEVEEAWSLLEGSNTNLVELAELLYTTFTPSSAWAAWQLVADGLYFTGTPEVIQANRREVIEQTRRERAEREAAKRDWAEFIARMKNATMLPADRERLGEVERLACGQTEHSRILEALGHHQNKDSGHRLLLNLGYWSYHHNPHTARCKINMEVPQLATPKLPEELRRNLSYLPAYAIDNEGNQDPDDAISLEGNCLWVHVADVAALVTPNSPLDQEARPRGANLYIPESITPILPPGITHALGLGLQTLSPALSFGIHLDATDADNIEICPSWVRVQRISYQEAQQRLDQEPFASLLRHMTAFRANRQARGSANIELPEVDLKLVDGVLHIYPQQPLPSRELVMDAMLLAGQTVAQYCQSHNIPIPYVIQSPPDQVRNPTDLAAMWAYRKQLKPSRLSVEPSQHAGLGLSMYTRVTSPLRRYSDLLVHQQLRSYLAGQEMLTTEQITERFEQAEMGSINVRRAERLSNNHWKMVWLQQHPDWQGEAIVVEQEQERLHVIIPDLALEAKVRVAGGASLNAHVHLKLREVDIPGLSCHFSARLAK